MKKVFALVCIMLAMACVGTAARNEALIPAMRATWESSIAESVTLGGGDPAPMTEALKSGEVEKIIAVSWGEMRDQALAGIRKLQRDGDIGGNVALIMMNEVAMFDRAMRVLSGDAALVARRTGVREGDRITYRNNYLRRSTNVR